LEQAMLMDVLDIPLQHIAAGYRSREIKTRNSALSHLELDRNCIVAEQQCRQRTLPRCTGRLDSERRAAADLRLQWHGGAVVPAVCAPLIVRNAAALLRVTGPLCGGLLQRCRGSNANIDDSRRSRRLRSCGEADQPGVSVSEVCRRHGLAPSRSLAWPLS
jgi:hypothetical protein